MALRDPRVAIIGAGMSGICAAAQLQRAGVRDFVLYEKSDQTGGVWQYNTYPGLFCDVPTRYFYFTFAPNPDWMRDHLGNPFIAVVFGTDAPARSEPTRQLLGWAPKHWSLLEDLDQGDYFDQA